MKKQTCRRRVTALVLCLLPLVSGALLAQETRSTGANLLRLFIVSDKPLNGGQLIDSKEFPKLGYIPGAPDLTITNLASVTSITSGRMEIINGREVRTSRPAILIQMYPDDARSFARLTGTNLHRRMLVTLSDKPLTAPVLNVPIETGNLVIPDSNGSSRDTNLLNALKVLVRPQ